MLQEPETRDSSYAIARAKRCESQTRASLQEDRGSVSRSVLE